MKASPSRILNDYLFWVIRVGCRLFDVIHNQNVRRRLSRLNSEANLTIQVDE